MPIVVGITGKACAGKNQYARQFEERGAYVIDVDHLGHQALEANEEQVVAFFGESIIEEGKINRRALGAIVFSDPAKLKALEAISHPWMVEHIKQIIDEKTDEIIVLNAALLSRMGLDQLCSHVLYISAPRALRYRRCKKRDRLSWSQFLQREARQQDIRCSAISKEAICFQLWNWGSVEIIHRQVQRCCVRIGFKR